MACGGKYIPDLTCFVACCEANFMLLIKLIPKIGHAGDQVKVAVQGRYCLIITLLEICKYTVTMQLSQSALPESALGSSVDLCQGLRMQVRVYYDAKMAEVVSFQGQRAFHPSYAYPNKNMYHKNEKEQLNLFLNDWLRFCSKQGQSRPCLASV